MELGSTQRELIYDFGGIPGGKKFKVALIGGAAGTFVDESVLDTPPGYDSLKENPHVESTESTSPGQAGSMNGESVMKHALIPLAAIVSAGAQMLLKKGAGYSNWTGKWILFLVLSCAAYGVSFFAYMYLLRMHPITKVYPILTVLVILLIAGYGLLRRAGLLETPGGPGSGAGFDLPAADVKTFPAPRGAQRPAANGSPRRATGAPSAL